MSTSNEATNIDPETLIAKSAAVLEDARAKAAEAAAEYDAGTLDVVKSRELRDWRDYTACGLRFIERRHAKLVADLSAKHGAEGGT